MMDPDAELARIIRGSLDPDAERARLIRQNRRALRLGVPVSGCMACPCTSVEALLGVPWRALPEWMQRRIIELHHLEGKAIDPDWIVPLCRNCHAIATERRRDLPPEILRPRTERERMAADLQGVEDWLGFLVQGASEAQARIRWVKEYLLTRPGDKGGRDGK